MYHTLERPTNPSFRVFELRCATTFLWNTSGHRETIRDPVSGIWLGLQGIAVIPWMMAACRYMRGDTGWRGD